MHGIGNEQDAQKILSWVRSYPTRYSRPECVNNEEAPDGWEFLGSGSFRSVWLSPEGVAYKVNHRDDYDEQGEGEVSNLREAWKRQPPEGCRLPEFNHFLIGGEVIVAIEAIDGVTVEEHLRGEREPDRSMHKLMRDCESMYKLCDVHTENAMIDSNGFLVVVDWGG